MSAFLQSVIQSTRMASLASLSLGADSSHGQPVENESREKQRTRPDRKNVVVEKKRRDRGMPTRMRYLLGVLVGLALLSDHLCQAQGNLQLPQENTTHDAQQHVHVQHNQGIRRNGMLGSTQGRHYTRGRRLRGAATAAAAPAVVDDSNRHVVLTVDNRRSSWREARRLASHMM